MSIKQSYNGGAKKVSVSVSSRASKIVSVKVPKGSTFKVKKS